jgi:PTH1 family peptidyl-tRNA hydrolase
MILIVGLGNPGTKYEKTRHNFGFMVLDTLADKYNGCFNEDKRFHGEIAEIFVDGEKVILLKPTTFMNNSGDAVQAVVSYFDVSTDRIWVVNDDIDVDLGTIRIRKDGGSAGHKGLESIIAHLGTNKFIRFRMGIRSKEVDELSTEDVVLQRFAEDEETLVEEAIVKAVSEIEKGLKEGIDHLTV